MQGYNETQFLTLRNAALAVFVVFSFFAVSTLGLLGNPLVATAENINDGEPVVEEVVVDEQKEEDEKENEENSETTETDKGSDEEVSEEEKPEDEKKEDKKDENKPEYTDDKEEEVVEEEILEDTENQKTPEEQPLANNSCPFDPMEGRTIIDFEDGKKILSSKAPHYIEEQALVLAGTYKVSLASFDGYKNRSTKKAQPEEIWKLILKTGDYQTVATSNATTDLIDVVDYVAAYEMVNDALVVNTDTSIAKVWHAASDDAKTANSVEPVCAALDLVEVEEPNDDNSQNQKPVITLTGDAQVILTVGDNFTDEGATANDHEDGDITADIVVGGDSVDTGVAGTYVITYNVSDSEGLAADEVTREVYVRNESNEEEEEEEEELPYAPYCGDGVVNQEWESCDAGLGGDNQCTAQCQIANQCVNKAFARVNTDGYENHANGDVTSDIFLGSLTNKIPGGAWFLLASDGNFITDPNVTGYEDVPGLAVQRKVGKIRTVLHGSHPHDGSKEHSNGNVEFYNIEATDVLNDTEGNNKLERGFDNVMDNVPGQDEVWLKDGYPTQSFFWLTVTTADDGFFTTYSEVPQCELPNEKPVISLIGDNPLIIDLFGTYNDPGATANDAEDGDITADIVVGGDSVDTNTVGNYTVTYDVTDSEGLAADQVTRVVSIVDGNTGGPDPVCSDGADNDGDLLADQDDPACHTDGDAGNPDSYDPNGNTENSIPVITLRGDAVMQVMLGNAYTEEAADVDDAEDGDIDANLVIAGDTVDTDTLGTYTVTYNAVDSQGAAAVEVTREVQVVEEIIEENEIPVITLVGANPRDVILGSSFVDDGATANDPEDGDITSDIVVGGDAVNPNTLGTYVITYNVTDSEGAAAVEVTRTVNVINGGSTGGGGGGGSTPTGGSGGGGGFIPDSLTITNEKITVIGEGTALITWKTNKPATSRVVYDDDSQTLSAAETNFGLGSNNYGYEFTTDLADALVTEHSMIVTNVNLEDLFYFRPISSDGTRAVGIELSAVLGEIDGEGCGQYLFEFIKFGDNNNPVEVEKLQVFLNDFEGNNLEVNGVYNEATFNAVVAFQNKYSGDVLSPWGLDTDTGYVYLTTRKKINEIYCNFQLEFPLTADQQVEVNAFKSQLDSLREQGLPLPDTSNVGFAPTPSTPTFAANTDSEVPSVVITEETEEGEGNEDSLAAAIEAVEGEGPIGGFFNRVSNFVRGLFNN